MTDAIVIGGGISGLSAAYKLTVAGRRVTIVEPGPLGGVVQTIHQEGFTLETGPNVFVEKPEFAQLLRELDLNGDIVYPAIEQYEQMVWADGRAVAVPRTLPEFFTSRLFSFSEKAIIPPRMLIPGVLRPHAEDESVETFFARLIGTRAVHAVLDPALKGIYGGEVDQLSARTLFPRFWEGMCQGKSVRAYLDRARSGGRPKILVLRHGAESLAQRLVERVQSKVTIQATAVERVGRLGAKFAVRLSTGASHLADEVCVATSGPASAAYLGELVPETASALAALEYATLVVVHVAISKSVAVPSKGFGILFPGRRPSGLLGVMFNSTLFPHTAPADSHLLTLCFGGTHSAALCEESDKIFAARAHKELEGVLGQLSSRLLRVTRWPRAVPQYKLGHQRIVDACDAAERAFPGLAFIGVDRGGVGVPDRTKWQPSELQVLSTQSESRDATESFGESNTRRAS